MKRWKIIVNAVTKDLHEFDINVVGIYVYHERTEEKVLDWFHSRIPIKVLEDFDISVEEYPYGKQENNS
jgi:hypothetical protein